ncbi:protein PRRC2A-like [Drosophila gunungcola]|uniref:protein PRRC2A-like n=1 Tax=Drosophila gunungcola TaxID=103775 RepID=UPI0022E2D60D|nr:protein PRRC2A-like [Drosophila gunungcola]
MVQVFSKQDRHHERRKSNTQQRVEHELLASPLVSRSPSPVSEADEESTGRSRTWSCRPRRRTQVQTRRRSQRSSPSLPTRVGQRTRVRRRRRDGDRQSEVSSDEDDVARMIFRRLSRATAGLERICLGQIPPSGKPKEWARILEARAVTVRQWEARRAARSTAVAAWAAEAEGRRGRVATSTAVAIGSAAAVGNAAAATATTCADATTTATTTLTITTTIVSAEAAGVAPATGAGRASAADHRGGGAAGVISRRSRDGWPAPEEAAEEARMREPSSGGAPPPLNPRDPRAKSAKTRRGDGRSRGTGGDARGGARGPGGAGEGAMGVAITAGDVAGRGATPEAGAADFVPGVASPTGEADAAKTAVGRRGTVGGGSEGGVAGAGGRRSATTAREAEEGQVELPSEEEDPGADATEIAEVVAISSDESGPEDASEEEEEGAETVSPEVSSDEDDVARMIFRMIFRRLSRATAGLGRICLGQIPPSGKPKEWARILEARAVLVRQWEARRAARTPQSPSGAQPPSATQPPLPPPRAPTPPPRSPSPPPSSPPRQQEWHLPQAQVAQALRTIVVEGRRCHQQTVTWMWPAPEEAAEEARMREAIEAIEWRRPPAWNPRDPRAKSAKRVAETADREGPEVTPEEEREAQEGWRRGHGSGHHRGDVAGRGATPEAGAADFVPGVASPTGEADAAKTAVGRRGTVGGGSGGGVAGAGGRRSATTAREAEEGQVGQARAGGGTALPSQGSRGPGAGV